MSVGDAESGHIRRLWLSNKLRRQWQDNVKRRRDKIGALFAASDMRVLHLEAGFDPELLSRYFLEQVV